MENVLSWQEIRYCIRVSTSRYVFHIINEIENIDASHKTS